MLYGRQEPTFRCCQPYEETHGRKAAQMLHVAGMDTLEWQDALLDDWMARTAHGRWANPTAALGVPRQNGKTCVVSGRAACGMQFYGEWVVYTSHLQKTSTETFEEMAALFDTPKLRKYLKSVKTALGREEIVLTNGGRCKFLARTRNGGRGQHGDLWIADECQELTDEQQGSFLPLLAASRNPQTIYLGTPPDENASGEVFRRLRSDALAGKSGIAYSEWAVDEVGDTSDESRWALTNPSLGHLINIETVRSEHDQMATDRFARERLGWWSPVSTTTAVMDEQQWMSRKGSPLAHGTDSYGVKFSADGAYVAVSACRKDGEGRFVELLFHEPTSRGLGWLADWLTERRDRAACVAIDGQSGALALIDRITDAMPRNCVVRPRTADVIAANTQLLAYVRGGGITHAGQPQLCDSATKTARRTIGGDGGWGWKSTERADAAPIESAALAVWAADKTKRKPGRKAKFNV